MQQHKEFRGFLKLVDRIGRRRKRPPGDDRAVVAGKTARCLAAFGRAASAGPKSPGGYYGIAMVRLRAAVRWAANASGSHETFIRKNGALVEGGAYDRKINAGGRSAAQLEKA